MQVPHNARRLSLPVVLFAASFLIALSGVHAFAAPPDPAPTPASKKAVKGGTVIINCDCDNTPAPNIGGAAVRQCEAQEKNLRQLLAKNQLKLQISGGKIAAGSDTCDSVTAGPAAWPMVGGPAKSPYK